MRPASTARRYRDRDEIGGSALIEEVLVTGGAGFIGSHFVKRLLRASDIGRVTVLDAFRPTPGTWRTWARRWTRPSRLRRGQHSRRASGRRVDGALRSRRALRRRVARGPFLRQAGNFRPTNSSAPRRVVGRGRAGSSASCTCPPTRSTGFDDGAVTEQDPLRPQSPYAASKAASDLVALSYFRTFDLPVCVTRSRTTTAPANPRKDHPAVRHQPAQGQAGTPARRRPACAQLVACAGQLRRNRAGVAPGHAG